MGVSLLYAQVPPSAPYRCYPGSDAFNKIGGYTLNDARGRTTRLKQALYTPVKQVKSGGYITQVGQRSYLHKTALKTASGKHAHHPARTPVNGNIMRVVGTATAEDDGIPYKPPFKHHARDDPTGNFTGNVSGGFTEGEKKKPAEEEKDMLVKKE